MSDKTDNEIDSPPHVQRSRGTQYVLVGGVILGAAAIGLGVLPRLRQDKILKTEAQQVTARSLRVMVVTPHYGEAGNLNLPGNIQAVADTPLYARASGYIVKLYVDIGMRVEKGQLLAEIESPEVRLQLQQAQADTSRARANVSQSRSDVEKLRASLAQSQAEQARASAGTQQAISQLANAQAKLAQAKAQKSAAEAKQAEAEQGYEGQKALIEQSEAQLELATATANRFHALLLKGFVSQQQDDQTQAALRTARAGNTAAKLNLRATFANVQSAREAVKAAQAGIDTALADVRSYQENINAARANENAAKANVTAAQASILSGKSVVQANDAGVNSQIANQSRFAALSSFQQMRSPFSGVITARNVDVGTLVASGGGTGNTGATATIARTGLFGLARTEELRIQVSVPQTELQSIGIGTKAEVTVQEMPGQTFPGTVTRMSGALDASSRTRVTEIRLQNPKNILMPGMFARVAFTMGKKEHNLRIPANTLLVDGAGTRVIVVQANNTLHFQPVVIGRDYGIELEVREGLKEKDRLVSNPTNEMREGMMVEVAPTSVPKTAEKVASGH